MEYENTTSFIAQTGWEKHSIFDERNFIEKQTGFDIKKLQLLLIETETFIDKRQKEINLKKDLGHYDSSGEKQWNLNRVRTFRTRLLDLIEESKNTDLSNLKQETPLNLSNTKATEKLIYLNELGVISFLMEKESIKGNINKISTVLSAITDENVTTLQPALNAMLKITNSPEKSPYYSKSTAPKVRKLLIELGIKLE